MKPLCTEFIFKEGEIISADKTRVFLDTLKGNCLRVDLVMEGRVQISAVTPEDAAFMQSDPDTEGDHIQWTLDFKGEESPQ